MSPRIYRFSRGEKWSLYRLNYTLLWAYQRVYEGVLNGFIQEEK